MKIGAATLGFAGAATAAVTSTVLLNHYLGQDVEGDFEKVLNPKGELSRLERAVSMEAIENEGDGFSGTERSGVVLNSLFDVKKMNRGANVRPLLNFDKGSCFSSFFPGSALSSPTQTTTPNANASSAGVIPANFSFSGSTQPVGCKMMKFSGAKDNAAFGYMTETTVRNNQYGLAMYSAVTNTKQKTMTNFEYWMLFMENKNSTWVVNKSYYFSMSLGTTITNVSGQSVQKQNDFYAKAPDGQEMRWSSSSAVSATFGKFFDASSDKASLWDETKDKYYVGLWSVGNESNNDDLFYDGSHERWALKEWFGSNDKAKKEEPALFLQKVKLTQKGKWQSIGEACSGLKGKEMSAMTTGTISACIQQRVI